MHLYSPKYLEWEESTIFHLKFAATIINEVHSLCMWSALYYRACALHDRSQTMVLATATPLFTLAMVSHRIILPSVHAHPPHPPPFTGLVNLQCITGIGDYGLALDKIEEEAHWALQQACHQLAKARCLSANDVDELEQMVREVQVDQVEHYRMSFANSLIQHTPYSK